MRDQRTLGQRTSLTVTPIGLGLAALGRPGYINLGHNADLGTDKSISAMEAHAHSVLDAAWDAGIRYFDAARSYGRAEQFLASWLRARGIPPGAVTVGSKWGYTYTANWQVEAEQHEVKEHSLAVLQRQRAESDANLGSYLNLYQIHSATLQSGVLDNADVLDQLADYRNAGLAIGLTLSGPRQTDTLRRALDVQRGGRPLFATVQATWNLLEPSAGDVLADAYAAGMGVLVKEALANGRLTPRNSDPTQRALLDEVAAAHDTTIDALALAAVLAQPWCTLVLSGAARIEHVRSNVRALDLSLNAEIQARLATLAEPPEQYWATRSDLAWN
jgi:aryl-alcohol dehydrogenase-like predicted oxidoreductase